MANPPIHSDDPQVQAIMKAAFKIYDKKKMKGITIMRELLYDAPVMHIAELHDEIYTGATELAEQYAPAIEKATDLTREDALLCIQQAVLMECAQRWAKQINR